MSICRGLGIAFPEHHGLAKTADHVYRCALVALAPSGVAACTFLWQQPLLLLLSLSAAAYP